MGKVKCADCGGEYAAKKDGTPWRHACRPAPPTDICEVCQNKVPLREDGVLGTHLKDVSGDVVCEGSPAPDPDGVCTCPPSWAANDHHENPCPRYVPVSDPAPIVEAMDDDTQFEDPTPRTTAVVDFEDPTPPRVPTDSSGSRTYRGRHLVKDPRTGEHLRYKNGNPKGFPRVTSFIKAATDGFAISQWSKHNVLIGAAMKPSIAAKAYGLKNAGKAQGGDWGTLVDLAEELSDVAGGKDAASRGTDIHKWAERVDGGESLDIVPPVYRELIEKYRAKLEEYGFETVPGLMELTTMVTDFDGVAGSFDRILFHRPSRTYVVGDIKSGKDLVHATDEIEAQLSLYAHGLNQNGVYDWDAENETHLEDPGAWRKTTELEVPDYLPMLLRVRTDVGVVIHMPAEGDHAGTVRLFPADLERGWEYAEECHRVRELRARKPVWEEWSWPGEAVPQEPVTEAETWEQRFSLATTNEAASALWQEAKAAGISGPDLNRLVRMAQESIRFVSQVDTDRMGS